MSSDGRREDGPRRIRLGGRLAGPSPAAAARGPCGSTRGAAASAARGRGSHALAGSRRGSDEDAADPQRDEQPTPSASPSPNGWPSIDAAADRPARDVRAHSCRIAGVPGAIASASAIASQLVSRMQPWDCVFPTVDGSGVPWMP